MVMGFWNCMPSNHVQYLHVAFDEGYMMVEDLYNDEPIRELLA
jgi:hypothetical protein